MRRFLPIALSTLMLVAAGCDSSNDGGGNGCGSGTMTATVAGASFSAV